ncbi:MAG: TonB-dependent receptor [Chitinophagales bacterium]|nr:TonB-dependent receptor [Chitinophagales bacterium]
MRKSIYTLILLITPFIIQAQITVTGVITDATGATLPGVNVIEKGTTNGTITGIDGMYTIVCTGDPATIVYSYVGYAPEEKTATGSGTLDVVLYEQTYDLSGVEVVGTRSASRSATESMVPVDVIDIATVTNAQGQLDVNQLLQYAAPSFNSTRQSGSDGADHIDPATLRGLGPDQTLVLINGKRRHQSSLINIFGNRGRGNTGTDLNGIPTAAIERIEILRDGASAQYGSDAIAGVINIVLKSDANEFTGNVNTGAYLAQYNFDGESLDGQNLQMNGNYGFNLGDGGFINVTGDYHYRGPTNRAEFTGDFPENIDVRNEYGDAEVTDFSGWFNMSYPLNGNANLYAFGGYNFRDVAAAAYHRDATSPRNVLAIYPNGFDPTIASNVIDKSFSMGIRGDVNNWNVDFNNTFGENKMHYYGRGTLNASLGELSPTEFDDGGFSLAQNTTSLDFTRLFANVLSGLNVAYGAQYRVDNYKIFAGEQGSWFNYGGVLIDSLFDDSTSVFIGLDTITRPGGSQGFPGFQPGDVTDEFRTNLGAYIDLEADFSKMFSMSIAARYENYSDFGNTINGKIAARLAISDKFALRASASTGFRAPSLAQIYFSSTFTTVEGGEIFDQVIADNKSVVARLLGIPALKQEESVNASFGFTAKPALGFSITVDAYYVSIDDRIVLTDGFGTDDDVIGDDLAALGVTYAQFFTNAVSTTTTGLDAILSYRIYMRENTLTFTYAANFNNMTIDSVFTNELLAGKEQSYFSDRERYFLLASAPPTKMNLTTEYSTNKLNLNLRLNYFGALTFINYSGNEYTYEAKPTVDISVGYDISNNTHLTIGASNLLNTYPTPQDPYETETGGAWDAVQMGFNGTFIFGKLGFKF